MTLKNDTLTYDISALIIDTIIGDLFFRDEEVLVDADCDNDSEDDVTNAIAKKAAKKSNEKILESVQMAWHEEFQDSRS